MFRKLLNHLLYQKTGKSKLRSYELSVICAFRKLLPEEKLARFDQDYATHDEVVREKRGKEFWTWCWEKSCGGVSLKSHPLDTRIFGTEGSGSIKVAEIEVDINRSAKTVLKVDVYYADGIGPSFYFTADPEKYFDISECIDVGIALTNCAQKDIPNAHGKLCSEKA